MLRRLPIRWRLAGISALLTFVILSAFAAIIGELTTRRIRSDFNNQLNTSVDNLVRQRQLRVFTTRAGGIRVSPPLDALAAPENAAIRIVDLSGTTQLKTKNAPDLGFPSPGVSTVNGFRVATTEVAFPLANGLQGRLDIQYARRLSDLEATIYSVRLRLILGVFGGSLAALLGGVMLARRAMKPVADLTATARVIAATRDPNRRVPIADADDEVSELARTLDEMLQGLESSRQESAGMLARQRQFVADASHELRTPLTSVLANLELLVEVLDGERAEAAQSALRSSQRMRRLVADLLLLARADARQAQTRTSVDLAQVLVEASAELGPLAATHRLEVDARPGAIVHGVRDELHRMALNLMENAVKHTPPGTAIRATARRDADVVRLEVEDEGPGVPDALRGRLFERFVRGAGDRGGSFGLGLSIVRAVAEGHGGTVLDSDRAGGPGARFVVTMPALPLAGRAAADADADSVPAQVGAIRASSVRAAASTRSRS